MFQIFVWPILGRSSCAIDQFRYIKIQPKTIDFNTRLFGNKPNKLCSYSYEPRTEVYCFRLNFNISKLVYSVDLISPFQLCPRGNGAMRSTLREVPTSERLDRRQIHFRVGSLTFHGFVKTEGP